MKILITTQAAVGHFHTLAGIGALLMRLGHQVRFSFSPGFCPFIRAAGFEVVPSGMDWSSEDLSRTWPDFREVPRPARNAWINEHVWGDRLPRAMIPDLLRIVQRWPPDVIVSGRAEIAGSTVGELLNIPYVTASAGRVIALSEFLAQIRAGREKLRADLALLPDPQGEALYRYLYLNFIPDLFLPSDQDARTVRFHMRPITFDDVGEDHAPPWLLSLPPRSLIYVTFGSNQGPLLGSVFSTVISGVRELGLSVVVTVGPAGNPDNLCRLSANVHVVRYIPQRFVLERAALVVCHGGINTVLGALSHGVPLLLIPTEQSDQLWNALRCESLGVGTKLDADGLSIESVSLAAETILGKERYQRATSSFRESLDNLLPLERGVELILRVARDGEPQFAR